MKQRILLLVFMFSILSSFSQTNSDIDKDGKLDASDNCKYMYNPLQEDLDNSGVGDACEFSPILLRKNVSILEDALIGHEELMSKFVQDSIKPYLSFGDGNYKDFFETNAQKLKLIKNLKSSTNEFFKIPFIYKKDGVTVADTLSVYIIRYLNWPKNTGKIQNGYIPYYYESKSNGRTGIDNNVFGPHQYFPPANMAKFIVEDIDNNGINDLIAQSALLYYPPISDTSKTNEMPNIQRIGIPVYIKFDSSFNATYYHENFRNPEVLLHQPDFFDQVDLNNDGKNEILNLGEHYHTDYFLGDQDPTAPKNILGKKIMKYLGMLENVDYNLQTAGKLSRYYTIEKGRLVDNKNNYSYKNLNFNQNQAPYISNSKFVSIFGSAFGDIDNDGDLDYIQSVQSAGLYLDVLKNDGKGNFSIYRQPTEQLGYDTGPEGKNTLVDINNDGYLDYFFGGNIPIPNTNQRESFLGYVLNDKTGKFIVESMVNIGNFGSKKIAPKYTFVEDLDKDNKKEIIVYRSTGMGSGGGGTENDNFLNDILIFTVDNGKLVNNTSKFIDTLNSSKMYSQESFLYFEDIDGDKIKDLFVKYEVDSGLAKPWPNYGFWEKSYSGLSYFKGSNEGKFKYTRAGNFVFQDGFKNWYNPRETSSNIGNDFMLADIDKDGTSELIHHPFIGTNLIIFKLYNCDPPKPTFNTNKFSICSGDSLKLSITNINKGDSLKWHFGTTSDFSNVPNKIFKDSTKLFVVRTDSVGCTISSDTISITKNILPTLPIVKDTVFCQNIISSTLSATGLSGNTITWYGTNATGGNGTSNAVVATTTDTTTKAYYVSQINNTTSCESPRAKITVKINPAPATPLVKDTSYCNNINADTLKATPLANHSLSWYGSSSTGGTASTFGSKPNTATAGTFSYYVSQINNATGCEGARAKIGVTINPLPNAPSIRDTFYCNNASVDTLRVNPTTGNTILWYGTSATGGASSITAIKPITSVVGTSSYYLSQITSSTGCESLRSKLSVTIHPIPAAPILSRDTANSLVSNVGRVTWFKDGTQISDTTQKLKPTSAGSYSVKTTQNGCISAMSGPYYYLVTDIIQLNNGEFIKLAPNPFINFINIDFVVKGHQRLNIEVFSAATGAKVATRIGVTAGSRLTFNELNPGIYFVRVASPDLKVSHQFKMVKL